MNAPVLHLDDGALVRLLDRQPDPNDDTAHADACQVCQARLRTLAARSDGFSRLLAAGRPADPAPPADLWERVLAAAGTRDLADDLADTAPDDLARARERHRGPRGLRRGRPALKAAAAAGILLAGALAAEPVREWIAAGIGRAVEALRADEQPATPPPSAVAGEPAVTVSFVPAGDRLEIRVDAAQPDGAIEVVFEDRPDALGEIITDDATASLLVLPDGFRARNAGAVDWSYRFRLPDRLAGVTVRVGDAVVAELSPEDGTARLPVRQ